ncbi:hypothetical protein PsYK624_001260 [Phanerochaete sordida]|uniref:RING-type domain-containing protein n=1 Tax=Phanerochaete sordida TaxID=48140 RepID=A0A9P3FWT6_9APHY|nr:hypothetical protein PsYK624_001260 [Phanerochaete sordida]
MMTGSTADEVLSICENWTVTSSSHLEIDNITSTPIFQRSLNLLVVDYEQNRYEGFYTLLERLRQESSRYRRSSCAVITRTTEIVACFCIYSGADGDFYVIFDPHPRPGTHPDRAAFIFNKSAYYTAHYLADLLRADWSLVVGQELQWETQLLGNVSGHLFVAHPQLEPDDAGYWMGSTMQASLEILALRAEQDRAKSERTQLHGEIAALRAIITNIRARELERSSAPHWPQRAAPQDTQGLHAPAQPVSPDKGKARASSQYGDRASDLGPVAGQQEVFSNLAHTPMALSAISRFYTRPPLPPSSMPPLPPRGPSFQLSFAPAPTPPSLPSGSQRSISPRRRFRVPETPSAPPAPPRRSPLQPAVVPTAPPSLSSESQRSATPYFGLPPLPSPYQPSSAPSAPPRRSPLQPPVVPTAPPSLSSGSRRSASPRRRFPYPSSALPALPYPHQPSPVPPAPPRWVPTPLPVATFICAICFDTHSHEALAQVDGCRHMFCRDCIRTYVATQLAQRVHPIVCPLCSANKSGPGGNPSVLGDAFVRQVGLSEAQYAIFVELQMAPYAVPVRCRRCDSSFFVAKDVLNDASIITCPLPNCKQSWCKTCSQMLDGPMAAHSCDGTVELHTLMAKKGWKYCPGCRTPVERVSGCSHMRCTGPGCNT